MVACEFCDLAHAPPLLAPGESAHCSRCGGLLARRSPSAVEGTLALTLAAGILLVMANALTFLRFSMAGQEQENVIATGVVALWTRDQPLLAALILFTTILAPALRILSLLYVLVPLFLNRVPPGVARALRFQSALVSWAMLDVYMLALLVALVKLAQMATVQLEMGAYCFVALFGVLALVSASYDREALWERVEELS